jgi:hypothetical protein
VTSRLSRVNEINFKRSLIQILVEQLFLKTEMFTSSPEMLVLTWDSKIYTRFGTSAVVTYPQTFQSNPHSHTVFPYVSFQYWCSIRVLCDKSYNIQRLLMDSVSQSNSKLEDNNISTIRDSLLEVLRAELHLISEKAPRHCHSNRKICVDWYRRQNQTVHRVDRTRLYIQ